MPSSWLEEKTALARQVAPEGFLVLVRAGGFYEAINKDAVLLSQATELTLTRITQNPGIKCCGFPVHTRFSFEKILDAKKINYFFYDPEEENK